MNTELAPGRMRVGFIGLGDQGAPMAEMIARTGFPLTCGRGGPR